MSKYQNKFRVESARFKEWDYSIPWYYFVTLNTKYHQYYFGNVLNGIMELNGVGRIVEEEWTKTKLIRKNVDLDYHIIMPNHLHGIIIINEPRRDVARNVSTNNNKYSKMSPKSGSLSSIIRSFKSAVSKNIHEYGCTDFSRQSRFYDRIIRNENELFNIRRYIIQNPLRWEYEKDKPENICDLDSLT
ncbi:MAG: transposase [Ignavibacteriae bacterium HGW-Ignavibacteriae-3]|nr:MAG: transposase [Ignavibacteriae bacterium HGW-Ignavibacteriae-3]